MTRTRPLTADELVGELALEECQDEALDRIAVARHAAELGLEPALEPAEDRRDADEWPDDEPG